MSPPALVSPAERYRVRAGLSQKDAAESAGISVRTLRYMEDGDREPLFPVLYKLAEVYGVDPVEMLEEVRQWRATRLAA